MGPCRCGKSFLLKLFREELVATESKLSHLIVASYIESLEDCYLF